MSTSANSNKAVIRPHFKIETRVSIVAPEQGVEVPLGYDYAGQWVPYQFLEGDEYGLVLTAEQLATWLSGPNSFECPFLEHEEAQAAVQESIQRCQALAETAEK